MSHSPHGLASSRKIEKTEAMSPTSLPDIPIYEPTFDEFHDFTKCVSTIEELGAHHVGLCKVIPPSNWEARSGGYNDIEDFIVEKPVRQITHGSRGIFLQDIAPMKSMSFKCFKDMASADPYRTPKHRNWEHLEKKYWSSIGTGRPIYGANVNGSLMRGQDIWNVAELDSILSYVLKSENVRIPGVNTPYLYYGMWRATFPWHVEDVELYSINYVHFGAPKHWYVIPPAFARKFEAFVFEYFRSDFITCPCFLRHKCVLISPSVLASAGIPTRKIVQRCGEFIITFPYAYHAGFNMGLNIAESINFALPRWIEYGKKAKVCTCWDDTVRISMDPFVRLYQPDVYDDWLNGRDRRPHPLDEYLTSSDQPKHSDIMDLIDSNDDKCSRVKELLPTTSSRGSRACRVPISTKFTIGDLNLIDLRLSLVDFRKSRIPFHLRHLPFLSSLWHEERSNFGLERYFNNLIGKYPPHCAVCSLLWTPQFLGKVLSSETPTNVIPSDGVPYIPEVAYISQNSTEDFSIHHPSERRCPIVQCSRCKLTVHASCYGIPVSHLEQQSVDPAKGPRLSEPANSSLCLTPRIMRWCCDACCSATRPTCILCYIRGGALKRLNNPVNRVTGHPYWVHIVCALANSGCSFVDIPGRVAAISSDVVSRAAKLAKQNELPETELTAASDTPSLGLGCRNSSSDLPIKEPSDDNSKPSTSNRLPEVAVTFGEMRHKPRVPSEALSDALISPELKGDSELSNSPLTQHSPQSDTDGSTQRKRRKSVLPIELCCVCQLPNRGYLPLARCLFASCHTRYHVTCAQMAGVTIGSKLYPYMFYLACDSHKMEYTPIHGQFDSDVVRAGDNIIVRLASNPPELIPAVAKRLVTPRYCRVAFPDGTFSRDTPPEYLDVDWRKHGPPKKGSTVKVLWVDDLEYVGSFQGTTPELWEQEHAAALNSTWF
ncbi:unnamed protein product [Dicrocoelium dendriticum]|nr:unnamed protein product [Dicrocoelium dendriticum]